MTETGTKYTTTPFKKAVKYDAKLRLAIAGPSGSGKTYTALSIATAMSKKVALVDTEHGSASKYADLFEFDVLEVAPPFHPQRFVAAIAQAEAADYEVVILDSLSHAWFGSGGMLDIVNDIAATLKGTNTFAAWKTGTPIQNDLVEAIIGSNLHIIGTMRSKQDYAMDRDDKTGKTSVRKVGMAPIQRDGFEYEFDVFTEMDMENKMIVSKTRCPAMTGKVFTKPDANVAAILMTWLKGQPQPAPKVTATSPRPTTPAKPQGKVTRPAQPTTVKDWLTIKAAEHAKKPATTPMVGLLAGKMSEALQDNSEKPRHLVNAWLWGKERTSDLPPGAVQAMLDWLIEDKDSTGDYPLNPLATQELLLIKKQAELDAGQQSFPTPEQVQADMEAAK